MFSKWLGLSNKPVLDLLSLNIPQNLDQNPVDYPLTRPLSHDIFPIVETSKLNNYETIINTLNQSGLDKIQSLGEVLERSKSLGFFYSDLYLSNFNPKSFSSFHQKMLQTGVVDLELHSQAVK